MLLFVPVEINLSHECVELLAILPETEGVARTTDRLYPSVNHFRVVGGLNFVHMDDGNCIRWFRRDPCSKHSTKC